MSESGGRIDSSLRFEGRSEEGVLGAVGEAAVLAMAGGQVAA